MTSTDPPPKVLVAREGELFSSHVNFRWVVKEINSQFMIFFEYIYEYTTKDTNLLSEDILFGLLNFVVERQELVQSLYFLRCQRENLKTINLFNQERFRKKFFETSMLDQRGILLSLFPTTLYYGIVSILHVLTRQCNDVDMYGDSEGFRTDYVANNILE